MRKVEKDQMMEAKESMKADLPRSLSGTYPVVGIGASAGGLEALKALFSHLPGETGMAYVVVQHQDPSHPSLLAELLARVTVLPLQEVEDGMEVEPDRIYLCPSNAELTITPSAFHLRAPAPLSPKSGWSGNIDRFFTSLALACRQHAVGVLLSGMGSDGTLGLQAIRAVGGTTFAQNPTSALFPQMPQSAIDAACVDHVCSCEEIARALAHLGKQAPILPNQKTAPASEESAESSLVTILHLLSQQSGVDFLSYKPATLRRRIESRMTLLHLSHHSAYAAYLHEHPDEVEALAQSVLIAVTDFFRDPAVFEALPRLVWAPLLSQTERHDLLRIWVPGCATGEEAYSLAISLQEFLQAHEPSRSFQIFATDVNPTVLAQARAGIYRASALAHLSAEHLQQFFTPVDRQRSRYRIDASLRERCVFAAHNLLRDPPFTRLDLISCRNVLIYLRASFQQQILQTFHYALAPEGFLLLGTSESIEPLSRLFRRVEPSQHLYRKQAIGSLLLPPMGMSQGTTTALRYEEGNPTMTEEKSLGGDPLQEADRLLLASYVPACVVVDANQEVVQVRGQTDPYLHLPVGRANFNVLRMARPGLSVGLRAALHAARKERRLVIREGLRISAFGSTRQVRLTVMPLKGPPADQYCLVLFEEQTSFLQTVDTVSQEIPTSRGGSRERKEKQIIALEQELHTLHAEMQVILEERDATSEVLQTANEEIRASNEELRSLNEELETSKEELQTINEELSTANQELVNRNEQLKAAQEYAEGIVETVRSPLVVLSGDLRVERANVAFYQFFQTTPPDTEGRLLFDLDKRQWDIPRLRTLFEQLRTTSRSFHDCEVDLLFPRVGRKTLLLTARRLLLERQSRSELHILLAVEDITERRAAERQVEGRLAFLQRLLDALPSSVYLVQGKDARLVLANRTMASLWGAQWQVGQPMLDFLKTRQIRIFDAQGEVLPSSSFATMRALSEGKTIFQYQETIAHADGTTLSVLVNAVPLEGQSLLAGIETTMGSEQIDVAEPIALVVHQNVQVLKEAEELKDRFLGLVAHELRTPLAAIKGFASMLLTQTARGKGPQLAAWQQEAITEIDLGADRLKRLTNDLLDVVRLQSGQLVVYKQPTNLLDLVNRVIVEMQRTTDRHALTLSLIPPSLSYLLVLADGERIEQVLINLLTNAIKYSPQGGEIKVTLREQQEPQAALISIADQGIGIPDAEQSRIFGRFERASNGDALLISGTGLGLYLCRELILQHEGQIWFESREGAGTTFFVRLPLLSERVASDTVAHATVLAKGEEQRKEA